MASVGLLFLLTACSGSGSHGSSSSGSSGAAPLVLGGHIDCISEIDYSELSQALFGQVFAPVAAHNRREVEVGSGWDSCSPTWDRNRYGYYANDLTIMMIEAGQKASESHWPTDELLGLSDDGLPNWGGCYTDGPVYLVDVEGWTDAAACEDGVFTALLVGSNADGDRELLTCVVYLSWSDGPIVDWGLGVDVCNQAKSQVVQ
jgi:hypothetical protein